MRGGLATAIAQGLQIAIGFATIPVLARLLDPSDFGLIAMVTFFTGFASMFVNSGLSMATIQKSTITHQQVSNLFWIAASLGFAVTLVVCLLSPGIAFFYGDERLEAITAALGISYIFSGLTIQHQALLRRQLCFHSLAAIQIVSSITGKAAGILWACVWYQQPDDYWALVWIPLVTAATAMAMTWWSCHWTPSVPRRGAGTRKMVVFGANLTGFSFANYFARNADNLLIGLWWGDVTLGYYDRAYRLFMYPLQRINSPLSAIMVPAMSRIAESPKKLTTIYLRTLRLLLFTLVPALIFVAATAEWWVEVALGPKYVAAVPIFRWLSIAGILQPISGSVNWLYISQGKTQQIFRLGLVLAPLTVLSFLVGLPGGAAGVAMSYALTGWAIRFPLLLWFMKRHEIIQVKSIAQEMCGALPLTIGVLITSILLTFVEFESAVCGLIVSSAAAVAVWLVALLTTASGQKTAKDYYSIAKSLNFPKRIGAS